MNRAVAFLTATALVVLGCRSARTTAEPAAEREVPPPSEIVRQTAGTELRTGLIDLHLDPAKGRLLATLPPASGPGGLLGRFLYVEAIETGLGSNPVGLDRGQLGASRILELRRVGSRVLFEVPNLRFRSLSDDAGEVRAVRESFATSVLWATELLATDPDGRVLVDLTGFASRDAHGIAERLAASRQGVFTLDRERTAVDLDACRAFPDNVELEAIQTFTGSDPGPEVRSVAPEPRALTFVLRQSLLRLPEDGYRPRDHDPRMGSFAIQFADYSAPLDRPIERRWIARHRLEKLDPRAARSAVREPVVYHVDRGAPEPVRTALVEGASWWAEAFERAGFGDAFRVELMPEGADPLDARYNVIQWVHRATRGWSYGSAVVDPRNGEIVKGHVSLGSLRIRQDRLLFEGLAGVRRTGTGGADDPIELALARIRQLSAHEVGHTLGLAHNFAASTAGRASVMDYPAPLVTVDEEGRLDFGRAYATGLGDWDRAAIAWAYLEFAPGADERAELDRIARATVDRGLVMLSDADARGDAAAHPLASLWDNGSDPVSALERTMRVRRLALARFGERNLAAGQPTSHLEEVFATVYLHHRFQLAAAAKVLGGVDYRHALAGDGQPAPRAVAPERQRRALEALLAALGPEVLDIPESALAVLAPRVPETGRSGEQFAGRTGPTFDALGAVATAADLALRALLEPARAARLVDQHRRDPASPDFSEVLDTLIGRVFLDPSTLEPRTAEVARVIQRVAVERMLALSGDADAAPWVRSRVDAALADLLQRVDRVESLDASERAHLAGLAAEIGRHLARPAAVREPARSALAEPPGEPIGGAGFDAAPAGCGFEWP
jgi:hypothetical protein